jgi:hypothetical protein
MAERKARHQDWGIVNIPVIRIVTVAALARVMLGRPNVGMARNTIRQSGMAEVSIAPTAGAVTIAALPREVIGRRVAGMA